MEEDYFYQQLGKSIQAWLCVESEVYFLYSAIMYRANQHLISVTFNHIQSFRSKIALIDSCLKLVLDRKSEKWKQWKLLYKKAENLNLKRNKIVHEPVIQGVEDGVKSIFIAPSCFNALALVKGQTSHTGPVITSEYKPSQAKMLNDHKVNLNQLRKFEGLFKDFSIELNEFKKSIIPLIKEANKSVHGQKSIITIIRRST
ncbi:MAG: hypothetical protein ABID32_04420 [Candidatus Omnitrophota bacterium]